MAPAVPRRPMAAPLVRYELTEAGRAALAETTAAPAPAVEVRTTSTRDAVIVESVADAACATDGQTSITVRLALTPRGVVVTLTCTYGPLAAPGLTERVVFVVAPGDLDTLATTIRAAVDEAHRQEGV